jgi:hypothetical protein
MWRLCNLRAEILFFAGIFNRAPAQGIEAEIPEQTAKRFVRNWSGKPGFRRVGAGNAPKKFAFYYFYENIPRSIL